MATIKNDKFIIKVQFDEVDVHNFHKQDYPIYSAKNEDYLFTLYREQMTLPLAESLYSGDAEKAITAIKTYMKNVEDHIEGIKNQLANI